MSGYQLGRLYTALARDDYYTQGGEPSGQWQGQGAAALGLSGTVDDATLRHVLHGCDGTGATGRRSSNLAGGRGRANWPLSTQSCRKRSARQWPLWEDLRTLAPTLWLRHLPSPSVVGTRR